jgi:hypothetical protein
MVTYGKPVDTNPIDALLNELKWTYGHVIWLRDKVQALDPDALVWGMTQRKSEGSMAMELSDIIGLDMVPTIGVTKTEAAGVSVLVKLYQEERTKLVDVAKTCASLNIDERRVRLAEKEVHLLVSAMKWYIWKLFGDAPDQVEIANSLAMEMFGYLNTGKVPVITP